MKSLPCNFIEATFLQLRFKKPLLARVLGRLVSHIITTADQFQGETVKVTRAPEPTDVLWENLGYTPKERIHNRLSTGVVTFLLIVISFVIIVIFNWVQVMRDFLNNNFMIYSKKSFRKMRKRKVHWKSRDCLLLFLWLLL